MNPLTNIPPSVRVWLYLAFAVGSVVVTYLGAKGTLGGEEMALFTGVGTVLGLTAVSNVSPAPTGRRDDPAS
jgi:hypothetical protein